MKLVKFIGAGIGPLHKSELFNAEYDFTKGFCEMSDIDADTLVARCPHSYEAMHAVPTEVVTSVGKLSVKTKTKIKD